MSPLDQKDLIRPKTGLIPVATGLTRGTYSPDRILAVTGEDLP